MARPRKSFSRLGKADVLVIDVEGASDIIELIPPSVEYAIFYARNEVLHLNLKTVAFTLIYVLKGRSPWLAYVSASVRQVNPRVAVTFIDNAQYFHELAAMFPSVHFVAAQNGNRFPDLLGGNCLPANRHYESTLLTFGEYEIESYQFQNTNFRETNACGSLRSSLSWSAQEYEVSKDQVSFDICFVSTSFIVDERIWFQENKLLAEWLREYLRAKPYLVSVVAMRTGPQDQSAHEYETSLYKELFGDLITLSPRLSPDSTYRTMDSSQVTISCGSSVSIESLGRGNRSFICHPLHEPGGLPGPLPVSATFILATLDREEFFLKLDNFIEMTDTSFRAKYQHSIDFFCHSAATREIDTALKRYLGSSLDS